MIVINTVSNERFSLNGIEYFKNFLSFVSGDKVAIYNAYDKNDQRINLDHYSNFTINGTVYASAALLQSALLGVIYTRDTLGSVVNGLKGSITPTSTPTGTGTAYWFATQAGTYTNFGGVVVSDNSFAVISRDGGGAFSISQTTFNITSKVNVSDVINSLTSTETTKPLSAAQGKILNEKNIKIETWTAKAYLINDQVNYLGKDWVSNASTLPTDIPGTSSKWVERLSAYNSYPITVSAIGKNLFDKSQITPDSYLSAGVVTALNGYFTSPFMPVTPSTFYSKAVTQTAYYDINKVYISQVGIGQFTTPANAYFVRISNANSSLATMQLELGASATTYESYKFNINNLKNIIDDNQITTSKILDRNVTAKKIALQTLDYENDLNVGSAKNLFDKNKVVLDVILNASGVEMVSMGSYATPFMKCVPNLWYFASKVMNWGFFDINKVLIAGTVNTTRGKTAPVNAYYMRGYEGSQTSIPAIQFEQNAIGSTAYEPFKYTQELQEIQYSHLSTNLKDVFGNNLVGKTWNNEGDSITDANLYQPLVCASTGLISYKLGIGGATIAKRATGTNSIVQRVLGLDGLTPAVNADIWTILGGVNDFSGPTTPLGAIATTGFDITTFYGAYQAICENILLRANKPKLLLMTPLQSSRNGAAIDSFRTAIIEIGKYYSVPVLDLYAVSGITPVTFGYYTSDNLHPNAAGTLKYYKHIIRALAKLE